MSDHDAPAMSVILAAPDRYEAVRKTMRYLRAQTARDRLEIVIVAPTARDLDIDAAEREAFLQFRVVEVGVIKSPAQAYAAGTRGASAPVVALAEEHSYPEPGWAEALIEAHRQPWAAVGPVIVNANPRTALSWAHVLLGFASWLEPTAAGVVGHLPGHNASYKRGLLLEYGPQLEAMLAVEILLHWDLRARGYELYLEPGAKTSHVQVTHLPSWIAVQFLSARLFASTRALNGRWSAFRRLLFTCGAPIIPSTSPLWRLRGIVQEVRRPGRPHDLLPRALPALLFGLALAGAGQVVGYAFGAGDAIERMADFEFHRDRHVTERDRQALARDDPS